MAPLVTRIGAKKFECVSAETSDREYKHDGRFSKRFAMNRRERLGELLTVVGILALVVERGFNGGHKRR
jgi:hypothetical protein